jgi:hypothetical protein
MKKSAAILVVAVAMVLLAACKSEASEVEDYDIYEIAPDTCLQMEVGTCVLHFGGVKFRMDLESCDLMIEWDKSGGYDTTMTGKCKPILTDEDDGLNFYVCGQKRRQMVLSGGDAIDYGPNVKPAVYRPKDEPVDEPDTCFVTIEMNDIGGAYMVLDQFGDLVSIGNSYKEIELDPGKYYIIPEDIEFYTARPIIIEVRSGETEEVMIRYEKDLSTEKGTLMVDLIPPFNAYMVMDAYGELVAVGFDSDEFRLSPGVYFVVPQKLDGFRTPKTKAIKVTPNGIHRIKVHHKSLDGTPINLNGTLIASL